VILHLGYFWLALSFAMIGASILIPEILSTSSPCTLDRRRDRGRWHWRFVTRRTALGPIRLLSQFLFRN
jgi:hypothetical protein